MTKPVTESVLKNFLLEFKQEITSTLTKFKEKIDKDRHDWTEKRVQPFFFETDEKIAELWDKIIPLEYDSKAMVDFKKQVNSRFDKLEEKVELNQKTIRKAVWATSAIASIIAVVVPLILQKIFN